MIEFAALSRRDDEEGNPPEPFYLYVDEVGSFTTESFGSMLSEARKFGLSVTMAHQYIDQLSDQVLESVLGNVGSLITFRTGPEDAERLRVQFAPYPAESMADLDSFEALARPLISGSPYQPIRLRCEPPQGTVYGRGKELRELSAAKYGRDRAKIEAKIRRLLAPKVSEPEPKRGGRWRAR